MRLLNLTNGFVLSLLLLVPGALKAMDEAPEVQWPVWTEPQEAKWHAWTSYHLTCKDLHMHRDGTHFFGADAHDYFDESGSYILFDNPLKNSCPAAVQYWVQVTMLKAVLDHEKKISALEMKYSISRAMQGDNKAERLVLPTRVTIPARTSECSHCVENITIENLEPFDLFITTNINDVNNN